MLTFLRKIRRSLVESGTTSKYLVYAFGEILLVMIGILLALQVNNWNENKKEHHAELEILFDLRREFLINKEKFGSIYQMKVNAFNFSIQLFELMGSMEPSIEKIQPLIGKSHGTRTYNPSNGVVNALISSGKIDLITNDHLRYLVSSWQEKLIDYQEEEILHREWYRYTSTEQFASKFPVPAFTRDGSRKVLPIYTEEEVYSYWENKVKDLGWQNFWIRNAGYLKTTIEEGGELQIEMERILELLDSEITRKEG